MKRKKRKPSKWTEKKEAESFDRAMGMLRVFAQLIRGMFPSRKRLRPPTADVLAGSLRANRKHDA